LYLPGTTKYSTIKLTRAFTGDTALWDWYTTSAQGGHNARVGGTITISDRSEKPVAQYKFVNAWPRKYEGPTLNAGGNDVLLETVEVVHAGLLLERPGATR
jgi:phage tail-like protein